MRAARQPQRQARADIVVEDEQLQFLAELAMVALLRFLEHREVIVELLLVLERGAVNALELRIFFVAFVIGAGDVGELERADVSGAHDVRPGAEIDEIAVAIERDFFVLRNVLDDIELELARLGSFAQRREPALLAKCERFVARNFDPLEGMVRFDLLFHLRLDLLEILGRNAVRKIDVVIKAVLDRRPGGELRFRPDFQNGRGEDMRRRMAKPFEVRHLLRVALKFCVRQTWI